jgi:MYXO-CTERM domain-containing protein
MSKIAWSFTILCCWLSVASVARAESAAMNRIIVSPVTITEGNSGQTPFSVQISLMGYGPVTVKVTTTPGTADESDYVFTPTEITLPSNGTAVTVTGYILGDTNVETDEYFGVNAMPVATTTPYLPAGYGIATISDDDRATASLLHAEGVSTVEGNQGTFIVEARVLLEPAATQTVTVAYQTEDGTAMAGSDYQPASGTLTFAPGEVLKIVPITILGDTAVEPDETFSLVLSQPTHAGLGSLRATFTIANDDRATVVHAAIADVIVDEGNQGVKTVPITITFDGPVPADAKLHINTVSADAVAGQDFRSLADTVYPPTGATQMTFAIEVLSDVEPECDEVFYINYSGVYMGDDSPKQAKVILRNDDGPAQGCIDSGVVTMPPPEPPYDGGTAAQPEVRGIDGGEVRIDLDGGVAPDASAAGNTPDTKLIPDMVADTTPDTQRVPDALVVSPSPNGFDAKPSGSERLADHAGCSCSLGTSSAPSGLAWLGLLGLCTAVARLRRRR